MGASNAAAGSGTQSELQAAIGQLEKLDTQINREFPSYGAIVASNPIALKDVQKALASDEALLFLLLSGDDIHVFAVSAGRSQWYRISGGAKAVLQSFAHLRCQVDVDHCPGDLAPDERAAPGESHSAHFDLVAAHELYRQLIRPAHATLKRARRLYVTTSSALGDIPLGLLVTAPPRSGADDSDTRTLRDARWLADRYAVTYLPAVAGLRLRQLASPAGDGRFDFSGYGDPALVGNGFDQLQRGSKFYRGINSDGIPMVDPAMLRTAPPLPGTKTELLAMAQSLGAPAAAVHLQDSATETAVKRDGTLAAAGIVAFATHGVLPGDIEGYDEPGLILTPPLKPTSLDDGILTASEVSQLSLSAQWVILSACNTASSEGSAGTDSLSGLARGFLYAGAHALLASHWRVSDDATAALTVETLTLYRARPGLTRASALQRAMRAIRTGVRADGSTVPGYSPSWAHPAAWGAFTHIANHDD
jgi:CHAT domain-containing protein